MGIRSAWLGVHFIDGQYRNVNGDDFPDDVLNVTSDPPEDSCLQFGQKSVLYNDLYSFHSCDTSGSMAGICTRSKLGIYLIYSVNQVCGTAKYVFIMHFNIFTPCNLKSVSSIKTCTVTIA